MSNDPLPRRLILLNLLVLLLPLIAAPGYRPGRVVVKLTPTATKQLNLQMTAAGVQTGLPTLDALNGQHRAQRMQRIFPPAGKFEERHRAWGLHQWYEIYFSEDADVESLVPRYQADRNVELAELSYRPVPHRDKTRQTTSLIPNDPQFDQQWHYHNPSTDVDIDLPEAWDIRTGSPDVIVAIMDTGLDFDHPDLVDNLWVNPLEIPGNDFDDDANGYVDDIHGWDFDANDNDPGDHDDHGTHTAGTVGAVTNNGIGVAGVAGGFGTGDGVRLMICKTLGPDGGNDAPAWIYAADNGAVISSNSWGYENPGVFPTPVRNAIDYFIANAGNYQGAPMVGGIFVTSAGNSGTNQQWYPGFYAPTLAVSATDRQDVKAGFSNFGPWVDIAAPGVGVRSTVRGGGYANFSGTSMSCPHVAGVLALIASRYPGISNTAAEELVKFAVDDIDDLNPDFLGMLGTGRVNAYFALLSGARLRGAITDATTGDTLTEVDFRDRTTGQRAKFDETGNYLLKLFGDGVHEILLERFGYQSVRDSLIVLESGLGEVFNLKLDFELSPSPLALLSGTLRDAGSSESIDGQIEVYATGEKIGTPEGIFADTFSTDGSYSLLLPAAERYQLVFRPQFPYPVQTVEIEALDAAGQILEVGFHPAAVFLVNDEDSASGTETYYQESLDRLGLTYYTWHVVRDSVPGAAAFAAFPMPRRVVWFTGNAPDSLLLSTEEQQALAAFLDSGGHLLLSGQNLAERDSGGVLLKDYLQVGYERNFAPPIARGVDGDPVGAGMVISTSGGPGNQSDKDVLSVGERPVPVIHYGPTGASGIAAVRVEQPDSGWKAVFLGFGLETVLNSEGIRDSLLQNIFRWFDQVTGIEDGRAPLAGVPEQFSLQQNFPNPFNPETTIRFALPQSSKVTLTIFNSRGQQVRRLTDRVYPAGTYEITWDGRDQANNRVSSGIYFYRLQTSEGFRAVRKMMRIK